MKKVVLIILGVIVLLVIAGVLSLGYFLNDAAKTSIEAVGPEVTGTPVTVEQVNLSPFSGSGAINSLVIANPTGFHTDGAIKVGQAKVKLEPGSLLTDTIIINEIAIDGAELTYEIGGKGSNIGQILKHIKSLSSPEPAEGETKVIIDKFTMKSCTMRVSAAFLKGKSKTILLPDMELTEIGRKSNGTTAVEASKQILQHLIQQASKAAAQSGLPTPDAGSLKEKLTKPLEGVKNLFNR